jgi:heptaprenyl diphosphate synthase
LREIPEHNGRIPYYLAKGGIVGISRSRRIVKLALLTSVGLILFSFEAYIPRPFPWMRIGLGNLAALLALFLFGSKDAMLVAMVRTLLGALIVGTLLTPIFVLSFGGAICSVGIMAIVHRRWPCTFGIVGVSIWGALTHNMVQLALVYLLFIRSSAVVALLPFLLMLSVATGTVIGALAYWSLKKVAPVWQ